jgi:hypothetical protein
MLNIRLGAASATLLLVAMMTGCATKPPTIYQWQGYQKNVDEYFRGDRLSLEVQTQAMEEDLVKITAGGGKIPPGYQAHMALLYGKQGKADQFKQQLENEKKQYPESETFVDFLLRNFKK